MTSKSKVILFLSALIIVITVSLFRLFTPLEWLVYDGFFKLRPGLPVSENVLIITIDDKTLRELGTWPLPRDFHASLVDVLSRFKVRSIVFDLIFSEPTPQDDVFLESLKHAPRVFAPIAFNLLPKNQGVITADLDPSLSKGIYGVGHLNVTVEADGKIREVPLWLTAQGRPWAQLSFLAAADWLQRTPEEVAMVLPLTKDGNFLVNFPNHWEKSFQQVSYVDILRSYKQLSQGQKPDFDLNQLEGKICFIGLTATGTSDLRANPLDSNYPMVGLQASVFNSIITRHFIHKAADGVNLIIVLIALLTAIIICLQLPPLKAFLWMMVAALCDFVISGGLFLKGYWVDVAMPLFILFISYLAIVTWRLLKESRQREQIENELVIAQEIQLKFLPEKADAVGKLSLGALLKPAKYVGGDLYDVVKLADDKVGVLIGDVAGKGVSAALIMAQTISLFRMLALQNLQPHELLAKMSKELCDRISGRFVTAIYIIIDANPAKQRLYASSAGHGPLLVWDSRKQDIVEVDLCSEIPLGLDKEADYKTIEMSFWQDDKFMICSDGIMESRNDRQELFGLEKTKELFKKNVHRPNKYIVETFVKEVEKFAGPMEQADDITIIVGSLNPM